jgi:hypothetical protein
LLGCSGSSTSGPDAPASAGKGGGGQAGTIAAGGGIGAGALGSGGSGGRSDRTPPDGSTAGTTGSGGTHATAVDGGADTGAAGTTGAAGSGTYPVGDPGTTGDGDLTINPPYATQPDLTERGNPKGKSFHFTMDSAKSALFKGDDPTLNAANRHTFTRGVDVYVPALYADGTPAPVLVIQDGPGELGMVKNALDNLTISKDGARKLPAFIAVAVANGGNDSKGSERGLEYDTMSDKYARFIQTEVLPAVVANPQIKAAYPNLSFTDNPEGKAALGCSSGGAAALTMGWFRPDLFRRIVRARARHVPRRRVGLPLRARAHRRQSAQTAARVLERQRERPRRDSTGERSPQLGHGEPAYGRGAPGQGLPLPLRLREGRGPLRRQRPELHAGRFARLGVARLSSTVRGSTAQIENGPMQIIMDLMVDHSWQQQWNVTLQDTTLVRQMELDYIRVYQQGT